MDEKTGNDYLGAIEEVKQAPKLEDLGRPSQRRVMAHMGDELPVAAPEPYVAKHERSDDPHAGILRFRNPQPLPRDNNPQTLAENKLPVKDRPMHYGAGLPATFCEVYHAAKQTSNRSRVTCTECLSLLRKKR